MNSLARQLSVNKIFFGAVVLGAINYVKHSKQVK
jgi:hypothetical protein